MTRIKRDKKSVVVAGTAVGAVVAAFAILSTVGRDSIVIQFGIQAYRVITTVVVIAIAIIAILFVVALVRYLKSAVKQRPSAPPEPEAILSISKNLDSAKLKEKLVSYATKMESLELEFLKCVEQLSTMDRYQAKLEHLLDNNGAVALSDTKDVLDKVEQYLCKAIRKVLNYVDVVDEKSENDIEIIRQKLVVCHKDCRTQLDQVKDFLFVMVEFLNKQGGDDTTPETLDVYKQCILKSIHEDFGEGE